MASYQKVPKNSRIRKDVLEALCKRAEETSTSVNNLLNQYLMQGPILDALKEFADAGVISMNVVLELMENLSEEYLEKLGQKLGSTNAKKLFTVYSTEPNLGNVIWSFSQVYSRLCNWFEFKHNIDERGVHYLIFMHKRGSKWTAYLKGYITVMLETLLNIEPKVNATSDMLEFKIDEKSKVFTGIIQQQSKI